MLRSYAFLIGLGVFSMVLGFGLFLSGCTFKEDSSESTLEEREKKEIYRENVEEFEIKPENIRKMLWVAP